MKLVRPSKTKAIPMGGTQPPSLYTSNPFDLTTKIDIIESMHKDRVLRLDNRSGMSLLFLPNKGIRNAPASGMTTNTGLCVSGTNFWPENHHLCEPGDRIFPCARISGILT